MRFFNFNVIFLCILILAIVSFFRNWDTEYEWRQKLTFVIETPNGPITTSNVYKMLYVDSDPLPAIDGPRSIKSNLIGEAITLEVLPDRYLFVLLRGIDTLARNQYEFSFDPSRLGGWVNKLHAQEGRTVPVVEWTPFMVTFEDVDDPVTVQEVDPDDLEAHFGEGFSIASITFEITSEPVTDGRLVSILKWIPEYRGKRLDGGRTNYLHAENRFANSLGIYNFQRLEK